MADDQNDARSERTYIVYSCPIGPLAEQIERYFLSSAKRYGPNTAHQYMPHCTLTGFFHNEPHAIERYISALSRAQAQAMEHATEPALVVRELLLQHDFHGLLLDATWLRTLVVEFARLALSSTRRDEIRLKHWLHLSLAYGFPPEQHELLSQLAQEMIDIRAPVAWQLRFYERHEDGSWTCHATWPLGR